MTDALTQQATATSADYANLIPRFQVKKLNHIINRSEAAVGKAEAVMNSAQATKKHQESLCEDGRGS